MKRASLCFLALAAAAHLAHAESPDRSQQPVQDANGSAQAASSPAGVITVSPGTTQQQSPEELLQQAIEAMLAEANDRGISPQAFQRALDALYRRAGQNVSEGKPVGDVSRLEDAVRELQSRERDADYDRYEARMLAIESIENRLARALDEFRAAFTRNGDRQAYERIANALRQRARLAVALGEEQRAQQAQLESAVQYLIQNVEADRGDLVDFEDLMVLMIRQRLNQATRWLERQARSRGADRSHVNRVAAYFQQLAQAQAGRLDGFEN